MRLQAKITLKWQILSEFFWLATCPESVFASSTDAWWQVTTFVPRVLSKVNHILPAAGCSFWPKHVWVKPKLNACSLSSDKSEIMICVLSLCFWMSFINTFIQSYFIFIFMVSEFWNMGQWGVQESLSTKIAKFSLGSAHHSPLKLSTKSSYTMLHLHPNCPVASSKTTSLHNMYFTSQISLTWVF